MSRILSLILMLFFLTLVGVIGFRMTTGVGWTESLYLAIITLTTVGSREPPHLDSTVMLFTVGYLICGLGIFTYSAFSFGSMIVNASLRQLMEKRKMQREIDQLEDHYIICGLGRMGHTIGAYLSERGKPFVVVDTNEERLRQVCEQGHWPYLVGDCTDDDVLHAAGIVRAKSLASVLPTDADNLYVVLSARMLNKDLQIVARAGDEKAIQKLEAAGASRVISPYSTGATKIARFMINPSVEDFLEIADTHGTDWELADVQIESDNPLIGKKLMETDLRDRGIMVIGIRRLDGERLMPPPGTAELREGDSLFAFGSSAAVNSMIGDASGE